MNKYQVCLGPSHQDKYTPRHIYEEEIKVTEK